MLPGGADKPFKRISGIQQTTCDGLTQVPYSFCHYLCCESLRWPHKKPEPALHISRII